jgi:hypothetical protein
MLKEIATDDFTFFTNEIRQPKDDFNLRKSQHDRRKLRKFIQAVLSQGEIIFFYKENGVELSVTGTTKDFDYIPLKDAPVTLEKYRKRAYFEFYYCRFIAMPSREPTNLHLDSITKMIVANKTLNDIVKNTRLI